MEPQVDPGFENGWMELEVGMQKIYTGTLVDEYYIELYNRVFTMLSESKQPRVVASSLCRKITGYLKKHLGRICLKMSAHKDVQLVSWYVLAWKRYCSSSLNLHAVFGYMNKNYCSVENNDKKIVETYRLAMMCWKRFILAKLENLPSGVALVIDRLKNGEKINPCLISTTVHSYLEMGLDSWNDPDFGLYRAGFERGFVIDQDLLYISTRSSVFQNSVFVFMKKIEIWLEEQELLDLEARKRALQGLPEQPNPNQDLRDLFKKMLSHYTEVFFQEFRKALQRNDREVIEKMYRMTVPGNLIRLESEFERYILNLGMNHLGAYQEAGVNDPGRFADVVYMIHERFDWIARHSFGSSPVFFDALNRACKEITNIEMFLSGAERPQTAAELLAEFYDDLLKDATKLYCVIEDLRKAMTVYKYLEDKVTFQKLYTENMGQRLLQHVCSNVPKSEIISKLLETMGSGFPYIVNTLRVFREVQTSRLLTDDFKNNFTTIDVNFDFDFHILKFRFWPVQRSLTLQLPWEMQDIAQKFTYFYATQHEDRKLFWLHAMSSCELGTNCFNKPYTFRTSALQAALLLQFNTADSLTFPQLQLATGIQPEILLQLLQVLVDLKVLVGAEGHDLTNSSTLSLSGEFDQDYLVVDIHIPVNEQINEKKRKYENGEEDKRFLLEAAIVRIAKVHKEITHYDLVKTAVEKLADRFVPETPLIKRCIERLIEKEYLLRENETYYYVV